MRNRFLAFPSVLWQPQSLYRSLVSWPSGRICSNSDSPSSKGKCSFPVPGNSRGRVYLTAHSPLPSILPAQLPWKGPQSQGCACATPNTTARKVVGRLWDVTAGQLLAVLLTLAWCSGGTSMGTPPEAVHAYTNIFRGAGGACSTVPSLGYVSEIPWSTKGCPMSHSREEAPIGTI